ncbi:hypothetical protein [uncultured Bacteroides sp.]|uniref:hypothetical protein n=1 Tax=uncultured Bacteroides sp. TaxID=162156 RepID=UPI002593D1CE|nr:hypothetical protein [uncultured Bacteroides sp.]
MLKLKYFLTDIFILSAVFQPIKSSWREIVRLPLKLNLYARLQPAHIVSENPFIILFIGTTGCIMVYSLVIIIKDYKISKFIALAGEHGFSIMALHFLAFKLINYFIVFTKHYELYRISEFPTIRTGNILWDLAYIVIGVTIPIITAILYSKIKYFFIKS